jgi:prenyltransferase beta subunit
MASKKSKKPKERLYHSSEIALKLDSYQDIFSDFDARPYHQKALSQDFLAETKRASVDKRFDILELKMLIPKSKSNKKHEEIIKKRLRTHFKRHFNLIHQEKRKIINTGLTYIFIGIIIMALAAFELLTMGSKTFIAAFLLIILEPAGWFFFWEGLDQVIFESKRKNPDHDFYEKMSRSRIYFLRY